jgi:hypothetical protein
VRLTFKIVLWRQLGAAIDMLENAIVACPDEVWSDPSKRPEWVSKDVPGFWYLVYHTLFWLDYYLSDTKRFRPPAPFNLDEMDPAGLLPDRPYTKDELLKYLEHGRRKGRRIIRALDERKAFRTKSTMRPEASVAELHLYTMRHVQHHTAQLNLILRQKIDSAPRWVSAAKVALTGK